MNPDRIEAILAEFRAWLQEMASAAPEPPVACHPLPQVDLHTLVAQFTALRHEVNLQTRAVRTQHEQNAETLRRYGELLDQVLAGTGDRDMPADDVAKPMLNAIIELTDSLLRAKRESDRTWEALEPVLQSLAAPVAEPAAVELAGDNRAPASDGSSTLVVVRPPGFLARLLGISDPNESLIRALADERARLDNQRRAIDAAIASWRSYHQQRHVAADRARQVIAALREGFDMSLQRAERALRQHGLEPVACAGLPFDPETMEVLEVVSDPTQAGIVIDEVRRGYLRDGKPFRFAQVRVAK